MRTRTGLLSILDSLNTDEITGVLTSLADVDVVLGFKSDGMLGFVKGDGEAFRKLEVSLSESPYFERTYPDGRTSVVAAEDDAMPVDIEGAVELRWYAEAFILTMADDVEAYGDLEDAMDALAAKLESESK